MVTTGQTAPDFIAPAVVDGGAQHFELFAEIRDLDALVLLFYPADFVPACTAELTAVRDAGWHETSRLAVIGISGDSLFSHAAYADQFDLPFPLVSDFHGGIADTYDLLAEKWEGHSRIGRRATVVVDGDWEVRALNTVENALAEASPSPVEQAAGTLHELGFSVEKPAVSYDNL